MKIKLIMLLLIGITLIIISCLYNEKLIIFNHKYQVVLKRVTSLEKYYNYNFFKDYQKDFNKIKKDLNNDLNKSNKLRLINNRVIKLEANVKNSLVQEIKNNYFQIIPQNKLKHNQYRKLKLNIKNQRLYKKMINNLLKRKDLILKKETSDLTLDKLFYQYQIIGSYQISNLKYLKEDKINNLKLLKKQEKKKKDNLITNNFKLPKQSTNTHKSNKKKNNNTNNICAGVIYSSHSVASNKQRDFLNQNKASSLYQVNGLWCLVVY